IGAASGDPTGTSTSTALGSYYLGTFAKSKGTSWMIGAAYDVTKDITVYISRSQSFRPNGNSGAIYVISALNTRAATLGLDPIAELERIRNEGADTILGNETGLNTEFGVKTSLWDSKLVSTLSFFQLDREGEALEDIQRQMADPLNYTGPNLSGTFDPNPNNGGVRWYSNTSKRRVEGAELEIIWTPVRSYQLVASGSWLWKAKTLLDSSINPDGTDAATLTRKYYTYDFRMPGTPEYRLNLFNTYTLNRGFADGLRVSLGARYSSEMNINNSQNYDSKNGGLTAGDYVVFDGNLSYPWRLWGHAITTSLNVTNLFDKEYSEGGGDLTASVAGYSLSPPRTWMLINTLSF
ncbi:MAG TPA: hypothetical protein VGD81_01095, partial [Opitutaceae bacterium]